MRITSKINLLITISVISLITISFISSYFKAQEAEYYSLVTQIKSFQIHILDAMVSTKEFEKSYTDDKLVFKALRKGEDELKHINSVLLGEDAGKIKQASSLVDLFSRSFQQMTVNSRELILRKEKINKLISVYALKHDEVIGKITDDLGNGFFTTDTDIDTDTEALQQMKNASLDVFATINRVILLVNQDLLLEGDVESFNRKYTETKGKLELQKENINAQVQSLKGTVYHELKALFEVTIEELFILVPELQGLYEENLKISEELRKNEQVVNETAELITLLSEGIREQKSQTGVILGLFGQAVVAVVLLLGGILIGRSITKPLGVLTRATEAINPDRLEQLKAEIKPEEKLLLKRNGELGILARSFDTMRQAIIDKIELIEEYNRDLENKVAERTAELRQKSKDVQSMLENMPEGILTVLPNGKIHHEYSTHLEEIFDTSNIAGQNMMSFIFKGSNLGADSLDQVKTGVGVTIGEDIMMFDMNKHLFPDEIQRSFPNGTSKVLEFGWNPIQNEDEIVQKLLVSIKDVTELRILQEKASVQQRELEIIGQILSIEEGKFFDFINSSQVFLDENYELIQLNEEKNQDVLASLFRNMHTIKGNARTYGLLHLTQRVHEVEQEYEQLRVTDLLWDRKTLHEGIKQVRALLQEYNEINTNKLGRSSGAKDRSSYAMVKKHIIEKLIKKIGTVRHDNIDSLSSALKEIQTQLALIGGAPLKDIISGVIASLPALAKELGKNPPLVKIEDNGILLKEDVSNLLKNICMHLYRNSMDHGLESGKDRVAAGKNPVGMISLEMSLLDSGLQLQYFDDGQGLNLDAIRQKAIKNNLIAVNQKLTEQEIANLIFCSGLSTAQKTTEVSGRGVGMDAIKKFIEKESGDICIELRDVQDNKEGFQAFGVTINLPADYTVGLG